jgi:polar amino acid transport system substrate-binding protein
MKKKNLFLVISLAVLVVIIGITWLWYQKSTSSDNSFKDIKKRGVLVVGSDIPYGVMEFFDSNNKPAGIDVDIAQEIASRLNLKLEFNDYDWDTLFTKLKNNEIDLAISSITITPERQKEILFSNPYFEGGQVIIVNRNNQDIKGINNLINKRIATQENTTGYDEAKKYTTKNLISTYPNFNVTNEGVVIINDLQNGKFDAMIVDYTQALSIIRNNQGLKIVGVPFTKEEYGVAMKLGNNSLLNKINTTLQRMQKDGTLEQIKIKWSKI